MERKRGPPESYCGECGVEENGACGDKTSIQSQTMTIVFDAGRGGWVRVRGYEANEGVCGEVAPKEGPPR
jgi:hypothetical protein